MMNVTDTMTISRLFRRVPGAVPGNVPKDGWTAA